MIAWRLKLNDAVMVMTAPNSMAALLYALTHRILCE